MRRVPVLVAIISAMFLAVCAAEGFCRGVIGAPGDWELSGPAWWQFDFLADCGTALITLALFVPAAVERVIHGGEWFLRIAFWGSLVTVIAVASLLMFFILKAIVWSIARWNARA